MPVPPDAAPALPPKLGAGCCSSVGCETPPEPTGALGAGRRRSRGGRAAGTAARDGAEAAVGRERCTAGGLLRVVVRRVGEAGCAGVAGCGVETRETSCFTGAGADDRTDATASETGETCSTGAVTVVTAVDTSGTSGVAGAETAGTGAGTSRAPSANAAGAP
jgi:hypothetical protein